MNIFVIGIKRGGQHFISNHICNALGNCIFYDDYFPNNYTKYIYDKTKIRNEVYGFEEISLLNEDIKTRGISFVKADKIVIVVRDIYNLFASKYKTSKKATLKYKIKVKDLWKEHCELAFTENNYIGVNYNNFFKSKEYRKNIYLKLGIEFSDKGLNNIGIQEKHFGLSSFDGKIFEGKASQMDVLNRYKHFINDPEYLSLFDSYVDKINKKYFGFSIKDIYENTI